MPAKEKINIASIDFNQLSVDGYSIHYASSGKADEDGLLFIHGTPGSWSAFAGYLNDIQLQKHFFMVSVDRLNWGLSNHQKEFNFDEQANAISLIIKKYPNKNWLVIGHSLGASIAPKLALNNSNNVKGLLLLAGTLSPELGKPRWYNYFADSFFIKWLIPNNLKIANDEIMRLQEELTIMHQQITASELSSDLIIIQGMKDKLVSPKNSTFVHQNWGNNFNKITILELDNEGHFLPWRQSNLINQNIMKLGESLKNSSDNNQG